jgi:sugar/nucleoside kinase (ribokinase family)
MSRRRLGPASLHGPTDRPRILTMGDLMVDVTVALSAEIARATDTSAQIRTGWGGSAANVAAWLAAIDVSAAFLGRVGADSFGQAAADALRAAGVAVYADTDPDRPTGTCVVLVHPDGERSMLPDAGANAGLRPEHLGAEPFARTSHLHLSAYTLFNIDSRAAGLAAQHRAHEVGMTLSVDAASAAPLITAGVDNFLSWTSGADLLFANLDEAVAMTGASDPHAAAEGLTGHYPEVVVKLGAAGAMWAGNDAGQVRVEGTAVEVVDTTGAGDAFAAGFLSARLLDDDPKAALEAGTALAARAISRLGARPIC